MLRNILLSRYRSERDTVQNKLSAQATVGNPDRLLHTRLGELDAKIARLEGMGEVVAPAKLEEKGGAA